MKRRYLLFAIGITLIFPILLQAEGACDTAQLKQGIQAQLAAIDEDPIGAIRAIISLATGALFDCSEDPYSVSNAEGAQPVLGPLALSEGFYVVTMVTEGSARVEGVALEGCGKELDGTIHSFSATQAIRGAQNLIDVTSDCVFYLEISKITAPWTLTIEQVK